PPLLRRRRRLRPPPPHPRPGARLRPPLETRLTATTGSRQGHTGDGRPTKSAPEEPGGAGREAAKAAQKDSRAGHATPPGFKPPGCRGRGRGLDGRRRPRGDGAGLGRGGNADRREAGQVETREVDTGGDGVDESIEARRRDAEGAPVGGGRAADLQRLGVDLP